MYAEDAKRYMSSDAAASCVFPIRILVNNALIRVMTESVSKPNIGTRRSKEYVLNEVELLIGDLESILKELADIHYHYYPFSDDSNKD